MRPSGSILVPLHRWLGLGVGGLFFVAAGTGAVLVHERAIDEAAFGPAAPEATPGRVPVDVAMERASGHRDGAPVVEVQWPPARDGVNVYRVQVRSGRWLLDDWIDAGSGALVHWRPGHPLMRSARALHTNLAVGTPGRWIVVGGTVAALPLLVLGAWVWWPRRGRWRSSFRIGWRGGVYRLSFDLHRVTGIVALPGLFFLTLTGALLAFPGAVDAVGRWLHGPPPPEWVVRSSQAGDGAPLPPFERIAEAASTRFGGSVLLLRPGTTADDPVEVRLRVEGRTLRVALDRYRATVLASVEEPSGVRFDPALNQRLHTAVTGNGAWRLVLLLSSLAGATLLPTSLVTWWLRARRRDSGWSPRGPLPRGDGDPPPTDGPRD